MAITLSYLRVIQMKEKCPNSIGTLRILNTVQLTALCEIMYAPYKKVVVVKVAYLLSFWGHGHRIIEDRKLTWLCKENARDLPMSESELNCPILRRKLGCQGLCNVCFLFASSEHNSTRGSRELVPLEEYVNCHSTAKSVLYKNEKWNSFSLWICCSACLFSGPWLMGKLKLRVG